MQAQFLVGITAERPVRGCGNARGLRTQDTDVQVHGFPSPIKKPRSKGRGRSGVSYLHVRRIAACETRIRTQTRYLTSVWVSFSFSFFLFINSLWSSTALHPSRPSLQAALPARVRPSNNGNRLTSDAADLLGEQSFLGCSHFGSCFLHRSSSSLFWKMHREAGRLGPAVATSSCVLPLSPVLPPLSAPRTAIDGRALKSDSRKCLRALLGRSQRPGPSDVVGSVDRSGEFAFLLPQLLLANSNAGRGSRASGIHSPRSRPLSPSQRRRRRDLGEPPSLYCRWHRSQNQGWWTRHLGDT